MTTAIRIRNGGPPFTLYEWVEWTSQANGNHKTKIGIIVDVVPSRLVPPWRKIASYEKRVRMTLNDHGLPVDGVRNRIQGQTSRSMTSYVVAVPYGNLGTLWRLYWPKTSTLEPYTLPEGFDRDPYQHALISLDQDGYKREGASP